MWGLKRMLRALFTRSIYWVIFVQSVIIVLIFFAMTWTVFEMIRKSNMQLSMIERRKKILRPARIGLWLSFFALILSLWGIFMTIEDGVIAVDAGLELNDVFSFLYTLLLPLYAGLVAALTGVILYYFADFHSISRKYLKKPDSEGSE